MKILYAYLVIFCLGLGFFACSNDDGEADEIDNVKQYPVDIKLISEKSKIEPFERLKVSLDMEEDDIRASYDSIVWIANGVAYGFFDNKWRDDDDLKDRSISDYKLGKHKVYVKGYKNSILLSEDSIEYEVKKPTGDFLSLNFKSRKENDEFSVRTGLTPINYPETGGIGGVDVRLNHIAKKISTSKEEFNSEYMVLDYLPWASYSSDHPRKDLSIDNEEKEARFQKERAATRTLFHDLITEMYGKSNYIYEGEDVRQTDLWDEYNKRFKNKLDETSYPWYDERYPVEIWITPTANICLYSVYRGWYYVVAEPR